MKRANVKKTISRLYHLHFSKKIHHVLIVIVILFVLFFILMGGFLLYYHERIFPGVQVAGVDLGGLRHDDALIRLSLSTNDRSTSPLIFHFEDQFWEIEPSQIGLTYDTMLATEQAYTIGRSGIVSRFFVITESLLGNVNLPLSYSTDQRLFEEQVSSIVSQIAIPTIPHSIEVISPYNKPGSRVNVIQGSPGREVDTELLTKTLHQRIRILSHEPITISILPIDPEFTSFNSELTRIRAERFFDKILKLSIQEKPQHIRIQQSLTGSEFFQFLSFDGNFQEQQIASYSAMLASEIDRKPQNARFVYAEGKVQEFSPAVYGIILDCDQTSQQLLSSLKLLEHDSQDTLTLELKTTLTEPDLTIEDVNDLGIRELVGRGSSTYRGSIPNRKYNLALASSKINGDLIPPGETFSFNHTVGEIDAAHGFRSGYIIKDGRTILGDGGGVCQVSTTLFRAVLNAGLPIVQRRAHSYRVGYYEQNSKAGFDATVYAPSVDFQFTNDTTNYLLLQAHADHSTNTLVVEFYGTSDGRLATTTNYQIWDVTAPPPDLYQDDPSLPTGEIKQVDWQAWGAKVKYDYSVTRGDETIFSKTFYSTFQPWQNVFLQGTLQ